MAAEEVEVEVEDFRQEEVAEEGFHPEEAVDEDFHPEEAVVVAEADFDLGWLIYKTIDDLILANKYTDMFLYWMSDQLY